MTGSRLLVGVASVMAGTTVLFVVLGFVANPILVLAALPFAAATYLLWSHATGRLDARMRRRARYEAVGEGAGDGGGRAGTFGERRRRATGRGRQGSGGSTRPPPRSADRSTPSRSAAADVLGVDADADDDAVRQAFREKARELHPDAPDGDEAAFKRARAAYERLRSEQ